MDEVLDALKKTEAILEGHFIGTSGKHLSVYINKNKIFLHTEITSELCKLFAGEAAKENPDVIVGPATGGIALSQWTAFHTGALVGREVLSAYTEQVDGIHTLTKRGYDAVVKGKRVVVVEDIVNTGKSIKEVITAVQAAGGIVVLALALLDRSKEDLSASFGVPYKALSMMPLDAYTDAEVPESLQKIPINTAVGHGAKYLKEHPEYVK